MFDLNFLSRSFIKRQTSGTLSDKEWQRVAKSKEWQRVTKSDKEWQLVTASESSSTANENGTVHFKE